MLILGADTSSRKGSVALLEGPRLLGCLAVDGEQDHSSALLPAVERLLAGAGRRVAELQALAVAAGPGSFTGLRVGLATLQGLALALERPCAGVDVLRAWALHEPARPLAVMLDAFRGDVLGAVYEGQEESVPRALEPPELFLRRVPAGAVLAGSGAALYAPALRLARPGLLFSQRPPELAASVAALGLAALASARGGDALTLHPVYLRAPAALRG